MKANNAARARLRQWQAAQKWQQPGKEATRPRGGFFLPGYPRGNRLGPTGDVKKLSDDPRTGTFQLA